MGMQVYDVVISSSKGSRWRPYTAGVAIVVSRDKLDTTNGSKSYIYKLQAVRLYGIKIEASDIDVEWLEDRGYKEVVESILFKVFEDLIKYFDLDPICSFYF